VHVHLNDHGSDHGHDHGHDDDHATARELRYFVFSTTMVPWRVSGT
jgi:hypothetical protein